MNWALKYPKDKFRAEWDGLRTIQGDPMVIRTAQTVANFIPGGSARTSTVWVNPSNIPAVPTGEVWVEIGSNRILPLFNYIWARDQAPPNLDIARYVCNGFIIRDGNGQFIQDSIAVSLKYLTGSYGGTVGPIGVVGPNIPLNNWRYDKEDFMELSGPHNIYYTPELTNIFASLANRTITSVNNWELTSVFLYAQIL